MIEVINSFLIYLKSEKNYSDKTVINYESDLDEFVKFHTNQTHNFDVVKVMKRISVSGLSI